MGPIDHLRGPGVGQGGFGNSTVAAERSEEILSLLPAHRKIRPVDDLLKSFL
jgi:hypothetical protein